MSRINISLLRRAIERALRAGVDKRGQRFPTDFDEAMAYSRRALQASASLGAIGGLGYTAYRDFGSDDKVTPTTYLDNAMSGVALGGALPIEAASVMTLGPQATWAWNRRLHRALQEASWDMENETSRRKRERRNRRG